MTDDRNVKAPNGSTESAAEKLSEAEKTSDPSTGSRAQSAAQRSEEYRAQNDEAAAKQAKVQADFARGQQAFSGGQYRAAIVALESAAAQATPQTRLSGEIQMLLVSCYEGVGDRASAQTLCRALTKHSDLEIRDQAKGLLYVLEAPVLKTKPEWLVQIPDLSETEEDDGRFRRGSGSSRREPEPEPWIPDPVDPATVNLRDRGLVWAAVVAMILLGFSLFWLNAA